MRSLWTLLWAGGLLGVVATGTMAEDRVLLVGVSNYKYLWPQLDGPVQDLKRMRSLLEGDWGFRADQIRTLSDRQATRAAVLAAFDDWLIAGTRPGDRVLFYFGGHGAFQPDQPGGDEADHRDETLLVYDSRRERETGQWHDLIVDDEVQQRLEQLRDRQVTVIVDSCHSGTVTRGVRMSGDRSPFRTPRSVGEHPVERSRGRRSAHQRENGFVPARPGMVVFSAVAADQEAMEEMGANPPGGVFTRRFVRGLAERAADADRDGEVSYAELLDYLQRESAAYCERDPYCTAGLTPQLEADPDMLARSVLPTDTTAGPTADHDTLGTVDALLAHGNQAGLRLDLLPDSRYRVGDKMVIKLRSRRAGTLLLFDLNAAGEMYQLFPNDYLREDSRTGEVAAGAQLYVPDAYMGFDLEMDSTLGRGRVIALLMEDPPPLDGIGNSRMVKVRESPLALLARLRERLNRPVPDGDGGNRTRRWSVAWADYRVVER